MIAIPNSALCFRRHGVGAFLGLCLILLSRSSAPAADQPAPSPYARARSAYTVAKQAWQKDPLGPDAAWQFALACFDLAELDEDGRARIAEEAIDACRKSLKTNTNVGNLYYLAMNLGQLARTRKLSALRMVDEMEHEFKAARQLDEQLDFAGPDRNLGLLYFEAPAFASVGSRSKARHHLQRAVELAPDYPENRLNLAEAYLKWGDIKGATRELTALEKLWPVAQTNLTGEDWAGSWHNWEKELKWTRKTIEDRAK